MPSPRDRLAQKPSFKRVFRRLSGQVSSEHVHARAVPQTVRLTEFHHYAQEISRNPSTQRSRPPDGEVEIVVPYDGDKFFTRQACADVERGLEDHGDGNDEVSALIGHLAFAGYHQTDLGHTLGLDDNYGSLPVWIPVKGAGSPGDLDELHADRSACVIEYGYRPKQDALKVVPVEVQIDLVDPDTLVGLDLLDQAQHGRLEPERIAQHPNFQPCLWLVMKVRLNIPRRGRTDDIQPVIERIALDWPTITSLEALHITRGSGKPEDNAVPVIYNPVERTLEWHDIEMTRQPDVHPDVVTFDSDDMVLWIEQPGELYQQVSLDAKVRITVPGTLMSGTRVRLMDATGHLAGDQPEVSTEVDCDVKLILDDAFARRTFVPYQHLHFDEIIPVDARVADIQNALIDRGFTAEYHPLGPADAHRWKMYAHRSEGPDQMTLMLYMEGRHHTTERLVKLPGDRSFKSSFESGELKVYVLGELPRASSALTREMNVLHSAIRDRFNWIRAQR
ncbi:hypothetical protein [Kibdelosporangium phytohabitans]|uniref:Uncharacterized protein n=1 Tax=Kibdelosporangium phytohabitans TaxID=860235 RepID=A0A0N9I169_9PSEU|nr:hypothetical protein [Kibdelosporangium phytohabitans]ALG08419.1 hypothetical protein AOZ06_17200 [Kibdelosporangium phytohabitans]MBE1470532.1 hypothetical protein [Kibdelosporangium phytohabitans]